MKKIICIALVFVFALSFTSCAGSNTQTTNTEAIETTTQKPAAKELDLNEFLLSLEENIVAAKYEYEGNLYSFTVGVSEIHTSYITAVVYGYKNGIKSYYYNNYVTVELSELDIKNLSLNDMIYVEGYIEVVENANGENTFKIIDAVVVI